MDATLRGRILRTARGRTPRALPIALLGLFVAASVGCERSPGVRGPAASPGSAAPAAASPPTPIPAPAGTPIESRADLARVAAPYAEALALARGGREDDALTAFLAARHSVPELAELAALHAAALAGKRSDLETQREILARIRIDAPNSLRAMSTELELAESEVAAGLIDSAQARFRMILDASDLPGSTPLVDDRTRAQASLGWARCTWGRGDGRAALVTLSALRDRPDAIGSQARRLAAEIETRDPRANPLDASQAVIRRAQDLALDGRLEEAATLLVPVTRTESARKWSALLALADLRRRQGRGEEAQSIWTSVAANSTDATVAGTALFESGRVAWRQDHNSTAQQSLVALVERFPDHASAAEAWQVLGWIAESGGHDDLAVRRFSACARTSSSPADARLLAGPTESIHDDCLWRAGFAALSAGHPAEAEGHFAQLPSRDDAVYWRAVALDRLGRTSEADAARATLLRRAPNGYYAWWIGPEIASRALDGSPDVAGPAAAPSLASPSVASPSRVSASRAQVDDVRRRAQLLASIDDVDEATAELELGERVLGPHPDLLDEMARLGDWPRTVKMARRLADAGHPVSPDLLYPDPFRPEMERAAATTGTDPILLTSIARQESLFDPTVRSSAGAIGLLQLMPATAADLAGRPVPTTELVDPARSAELGARELRRHLERYDGRLVLAIAAYNAGPAAVARWLTRFPGVPGDEFVERISFRETRNYVKTVLRNYRQYRSLRGVASSPALPLY